MYAAQAAALGALHHKAYRLGKALEIPLHLAQHFNLRVQRVELQRSRIGLFLQAVALLRAGIQTQLIARDGVFGRCDVLFGLFQPRGAVCFLLPDLRKALFGGSAVGFQLLASL